MNVGTQVYIYQQRSSAEFGKPFSDTLPEVFAQVRAAGFDGLELPLTLCATPEGVQQVGDLLTQYDLQLPSVYASGTLHDDQASETVWTILEQVAEARQLGLRAVTCNPAPIRGRAKTDAELQTQARWLDQLGSQLQSRGINLALHFHAPELADNGRELWYDFDHSTQANVGLCLDTDWAWRAGIDPQAILERYGNRLVSLHVRDARDGKWTQALGEGTHPYGPLVQRLRALNFDGWVNVELADEPGVAWTRSLEENMRLSREWVRKTFGA